MLKLTSSKLLLLLLAAFALSFSSCEDDEDTPNNPVIGSITDIVEGDANFTTLLAALERTGLDATLDISSANITVFAPNNAAFTASGIDLGSVSDDDLRNILLYHVIGGNVKAADIAEGESTAETLNENGAAGSALPVFISNSGGTISLSGADGNSASVTTADITAVNGTIHIIDDVLLPPTIVDRAIRAGDFSILLDAVTRAGLAGTLSGPGTFTVFAPTDQAFMDAGIDLDALSAEAIADVLRYHVLGATVASSEIAGGSSFPATINTNGPGDSPLSLLINNADDAIVLNGDAEVVLADVSGSNGVIHAINSVLSPQSIVDFVVKAPELDSLQGAVTATGLVPTLSADGPFTVFAPLNGGFEAVADTVATMTTERVTGILTYHVIGNANVRADMIPDSAATVQGDFLFFGGDNNATITTGSEQEVPIGAVNIQATNGVVHLVPTVLLPADF